MVLRCLVFGLHNAIGGIERYIYNYYPFLMENGVQLDFVSPYPTLAFQRSFLKKGSKIYSVPNFKKRPVEYSKKIYRIIKEGRYDIVYVNMLSAANVLPFVIARKARVKRIIAHSHNNDTPKGLIRKILHSVNYKLVELLATDFWACSQEAGRWLFPNIETKKVVIIPNAIPMSSFAFSKNARYSIRKKLCIRPDTFVFGHVGRFEDQKNHLFLISLFGELCRIEKNVKLLLVGDGVLRSSIEAEIHQLRLEKQVQIIGSVQDIAPYYSAMDAFLFPSKFEGFGMAALEAQVSGLPCVVSDRLSSSVNLTNIQYVSLKQMNQWIDRCMKLIAQGEIRDNERRNQYTLCKKSNFSIENAEKRLLNCFLS
jgi:glycosyltransferase involved in cell wall biosynthesis